jgi:ADP-heptose:LPS heptosyltransferase
MLAELERGARVMILRLRSLGDAVLTTPAIALLHEHRPDLEIAIAIERRFAEVYRGNPAIRTIAEDPDIAAIRRFRPRLVINFHGGSRSLWMTALSGARFRAGFGHHCAAHWIYTHPIPRAQQILGEERPVHTAEHLASAMFYLGVPQQMIPRAALFVSDPQPIAGLAVIHPFASEPAKTWPADRFVETAHALRDQGLAPIFIGGPKDDFTPFAGFDARPGQSLAETKQLLAHARLFLGNDSGPAHMAAAFGLPVIVLFGPSDARAWHPWQTDYRLFENLATVTSTEVLEAARELLTSASDIRR